MVNDERDIKQFIAMFSKDDMSLLTNKGDNNICTEYFDSFSSRNYFKNNFEENKKVNGSPCLVGKRVCNTTSSYKIYQLKK